MGSWGTLGDALLDSIVAKHTEEVLREPSEARIDYRLIDFPQLPDGYVWEFEDGRAYSKQYRLPFGIRVQRDFYSPTLGVRARQVYYNSSGSSVSSIVVVPIHPTLAAARRAARRIHARLYTSEEGRLRYSYPKNGMRTRRKNRGERVEDLRHILDSIRLYQRTTDLYGRPKR